MVWDPSRNSTWASTGTGDDRFSCPCHDTRNVRRGAAPAVRTKTPSGAPATVVPGKKIRSSQYGSTAGVPKLGLGRQSFWNTGDPWSAVSPSCTVPFVLTTTFLNVWFQAWIGNGSRIGPRAVVDRPN